jgi:P-type E1-E2 ATPase
MVITFGVVLMFTSIREGLEDYKRYKKDRKANEKKYVWYDDKNIETKGFEYKSSKKIHVGEIMKIFKDDELPADICLLKSSNRSGVCFIDRVNLDGESNLKDKKCHHIIQSMSDRDLCNISGILKCDKPNEQLDYWEGYMRILRQGREDIKISLE